MNQQNTTYKILGIMSGTSFDGIDFCLSRFQQKRKNWQYKILAADTIKYPKKLKEKMLVVEKGSSAELIQLHFEYGHFLGKRSIEFLQKHNEDTDYIASHGHTVFHQIENGFTFQLGHGAAIAATSQIKCISDFRSLDVALNGQGAPLVPIGDELLFSNHSCCINIGGIINLSFRKKTERYAFDVVPANMILNFLYRQSFEGEFDTDGIQSSQGQLDKALYEELNNLPFYHQSGPKSLGKEFVFNQVIPILERSSISTTDKLYTFSQHIINQVVKVLKKEKLTQNVLITGGGAKNSFLMKLIKQHRIDISTTTSQIIDFKEALIFAFLGVLRIKEEENTLKNATGAIKNSCGGSIFLP